jgi:hypothetical protein
MLRWGKTGRQWNIVQASPVRPHLLLGLDGQGGMGKQGPEGGHKSVRQDQREHGDSQQ